MANTSQVTLDGSYVPVSATEPKNPIAYGWYPTHIVDWETVVKPIRGKHRARIYNPKLEVAPEVEGFKFNIKDISGNQVEVPGEQYKGKTFRSMGVFYFLSPQPGDDFEPNPTGNTGYLYMCQALGIDLVESEVNGEKVFKLPELTKDDIVGLPVLACVGESKPWIGRDGVSRTSFEVKAYREWKEGKKKDVLDDIPF